MGGRRISLRLFMHLHEHAGVTAGSYRHSCCCPCIGAPKGDREFLMSPPCLEFQGCHFFFVVVRSDWNSGSSDVCCCHLIPVFLSAVFLFCLVLLLLLSSPFSAFGPVSIPPTFRKFLVIFFLKIGFCMGLVFSYCLAAGK